MVAPQYQPDVFECALLLLRLREARDQEREISEDKGMSRFRVSELTLKRICNRPRLHPEFLLELQDALLRAGWALFFADRSYGVVKLSAVDNWTRLGSKRIRDELDAVAKGDFDFKTLLHLAEPDQVVQDD